MPSIDIPVPIDLQKMFDLPPCDKIKLPTPSPIKIQLPTGGSIQAFSDISKGVPTDCSMTFNLLVQLAPLLASMECLVKVLKLLKPLIDVVKALPDPIKLTQVVPDFLNAAAELAPCLLVPTPASIIPFVRDILCLILQVLTCFLGQLNSLIGTMSGLTLQLNAARQSGNIELQRALECSQENAAISAQNLTNSIGPIGALLDLVGPFMDIAGVQPIQLPKLGSQTDIGSLNQAAEAIQSVVDAIKIVVGPLGGC